jgi:hypothetical protein
VLVLVFRSTAVSLAMEPQYAFQNLIPLFEIN